mgnify:CR=1 FL=1
MEKENCLILLKPDCIRKRLIGKVISMIEDSFLDITSIKLVIPSKEQIEKHYPDKTEWLRELGTKKIESYKKRGLVCDTDPESIGRMVRNELIEYLSGKPMVAIIVFGDNSIYHMRKLAGSTEPINAEPSTIRGKFSTDSFELADFYGRPLENIIHVSDSKKSAEEEIKIWFPEFKK